MQKIPTSSYTPPDITEAVGVMQWLAVVCSNSLRRAGPLNP